MSITAYIAGPLGVAVVPDATGPHLLDLGGLRRPMRAMDWTVLRLQGVDIEPVEAPDLDGLAGLLAERHAAHDALTHTLLSLDPILRDETAALNLEVAEEMLAAERLRAFVRHRLLARPAPEALNLDRALRLAEAQEAVHARALFQAVREGQEAIRRFTAAWHAVAPDFFAERIAQDEAERALVEAGAVADFVEAIATRNFKHLDDLVVKYGMRRDLAAHTAQLMQLLAAIRDDVWAQFSYHPPPIEPTMPVEEEAEGEQADPIRALLIQIIEKDRSARTRRQHGRTRSAEDSLALIDSQIERIESLLQTGREGEADRVLQDLLASHAEHDEKQHATKSLTRLVHAAEESGALEQAARWSAYAKMLNVEDPFVRNAESGVLKASFTIQKVASTTAVVRVGKALDFRNAAEFKARCQEHIRAGVHGFILDFSGTGILDSTGLGVIFSLYRQLAPADGQVVFASVSRPVQVVVQLTRTYKVFQQFPTVEDALGAMSQPAPTASTPIGSG